MAAAEGTAEPEVLTGKKEEAAEAAPEAPGPAPGGEKKPEAPPAE